MHQFTGRLPFKYTKEAKTKIKYQASSLHLVTK